MDRITSAEAGDHKPSSATAPGSASARREDTNLSQVLADTAPSGDTYPSLKAFLAENATLVFFAGSLTSLTTFLVNLHLGWLDTYLKAILLAAAGTVWFEFHAQWPEEVRLDRRRPGRPAAGAWRLVAFSYLMQLTLVLFAIWAVVQAPEVVIPLLVIGGVVMAWQRFAGSHHHRPVVLVVLILVAFLVSELALERLFPHEPTLIDRFVRNVVGEIERLDEGL